MGIHRSEQIGGELTFNISSLPQLPYLSKGLGERERERRGRQIETEKGNKSRKKDTADWFSQQIGSLSSTFFHFSYIRSLLPHITIRPPLSPINQPGNTALLPDLFIYLFHALNVQSDCRYIHVTQSEICFKISRAQ